MTKRTCGQALPYLLAEYGVDTVFGMPGVHSLEFYRTIEQAGIRHIGVRHEQGAGFMADGYARACGKPGVCTLISGPGVTNVSTPLGQAYSDSVPLLILSTVIAREDIGMNRGMLHEISDQRAVTAPLTAISEVIWDEQQMPGHLARAMAMFASTRPRPAHLSFPLDVLEKELEIMPKPMALPQRPWPSSAGVKAIAKLIEESNQIVILLGGGAIESGAATESILEKTGALLATTIAGKGAVPESHPQSLGSTLQRVETRKLIAQADLVVAVGTGDCRAGPVRSSRC